MANHASLKTIVAALAVVGMAAGTAQAASLSATASANVLTPVSVTESTALNFGDLMVGPLGGTLAIDTAGARTVTGDVVTYTAGTTAAAGSYAVKGSPNAVVNVSYTAGSVASGANTMAVDTFTDNTAVFPLNTLRLDVNGNAILNVGATLHVAGNQAAGIYTGSYTITVNY